MMQTFCLRTIYRNQGVHLDSDFHVALDMGRVSFVREARLPVQKYRITGKAPSGKVKLTVQMVNQVFAGDPFLTLVTVQSCEQDSANRLSVRRTLEHRRDEVVAIAHWVDRGLVGGLVADALFSRPSSASDDTTDVEGRERSACNRLLLIFRRARPATESRGRGPLLMQRATKECRCPCYALALPWR